MKPAISISILLTLSAAAGVASPLSVSASYCNRSYPALFENIGGGQLRITVSNTALTAPPDEGGVIGALFFSLLGNPTLTPVSMSLPVGSTIVNGTGAPGPNWKYAQGLSGPGGATQ